MTARRLLSAILALSMAVLACGRGGGTLPPTDTPAPQPTNDNTNTNGNGNDNSNASPTLTVQGTVTAQAGGMPIKGAHVDILQPGTTVQQFLNDKEPDAEVFAVALSDAQGQYTLNKPLQRNQAYSLLVAVNGYKAAYTDNFLVDNSAPDPYTEDAQLVQ